MGLIKHPHRLSVWVVKKTGRHIMKCNSSAQVIRKIALKGLFATS